MLDHPPLVNCSLASASANTVLHLALLQWLDSEAWPRSVQNQYIVATPSGRATPPIRPDLNFGKDKTRFILLSLIAQCLPGLASSQLNISRAILIAMPQTF
jgi:hypothetical protein